MAKRRTNCGVELGCVANCGVELGVVCIGMHMNWCVVLCCVELGVRIGNVFKILLKLFETELEF